MYTEQVDSLLNLLDLSNQSGLLSLTPGETAETSPWLALCRLVDGKVMECKIYQTIDELVVMGGPPALDWLKTQKGVYWQLEDPPVEWRGNARERKQQPANGNRTETAHSAYQDQLGPLPLSPGTKPRRTWRGQQSTPPRSWPRLLRQVFSLTDGERTSAEIARLLANKTVREIEETLAILRDEGFIE